jgi:hypothetical protein
MKSYPLFVLTLLSLFLINPASAQKAEIRHHTQAFNLDTGMQSGRSTDNAPRLAYSTIVRAPGAPWIRLSFADASLGRGSYLVITSLQDGAHQRLNARTLAQWQNSSAYFNGDAVRVDLHVAPKDQNVFIRMKQMIAGDTDGIESRCGTTDDRIDSTDPRAGRMLTIGCTAWLIEDGRFVSAGHCTESASLANTVEFNVPPSLSNGTIVHPGPEDQYVIDDASRVFSNVGIGNDWGVFETFPNSETGLTALQAQGAWFDVVQDLGPATIRITGYGIDDGVDNQTEQTSTGPNAGSSGTTLRYRVDTEGGNSGSPVIDEATGNAIGIHTNAGCTSGGGSNSGTSNFNTALWAQIGSDGGDDISLQARAKRQGNRRQVSLKWEPADGGNVNILRDGNIVQTTTDDGTAKDNLGTTTGTFTYQVCETDSGDCSNEVVVVVN